MDKEFLIEFSIEFVNRCRKSGISSSTRQAITISKLANARKLRRSELEPNDLLEIAKLTTAPPNQEKAAQIAKEILEGTINEGDTEVQIEKFLEKLEDEGKKKLDQNSIQETLDITKQSEDSKILFIEDQSRKEFSQWATDSLIENGFHSTFEVTTNIDRQKGTDLTGELIEIAKDYIEKISIEEFLKNVQEGFEWIDIVSNKLKEKKESGELDHSLLQELVKAEEQISDPIIKQEFSEGPLSQAISKLLEEATTFEQIVDLKQLAEQNKANFPNELAIKKGQELEFTNLELAELTEDVESFVKEMIKEGKTDHRALSRSLQRGKISTSTFKELVNIAIERNDEVAVAGFLEDRFIETLRSLEKKENTESLLQAALGMSNGENILRDWFEQGSQVPERFKSLLHTYSHLILIELGRKWKSKIGDGIERGVLTGGYLRPWNEGDDFDQIDLEESIDNILQMGKGLKDIEPSDILVRDYEYGQRAVLLLIDSSGSMVGLPLKTAVATGVMLAYALRKEEMGIGVFQSNTSIFCSVLDRQRDLDRIVNGLLSLEGKGGTVIKAGIEWVEEELKRSRSKERVVFIVTDSLIYDLKENIEKIRAIADDTTKIVFLVPGYKDDYKNQKWLIEESGGIFVPLYNWKEFPNKVREILARG